MNAPHRGGLRPLQRLPLLLLAMAACSEVNMPEIALTERSHLVAPTARIGRVWPITKPSPRPASTMRHGVQPRFQCPIRASASARVWARRCSTSASARSTRWRR